MRLLTTLAATLAFSSLATGCVGDQESLIVLRAVGGVFPCVFTDSTTTFLGRGTVDASFDTSYVAGFVLKNNLVENSTSGIETSEMKIRDVEVRLEMPSLPGALDSVDPAMLSFKQDVATNSFDGADETIVMVEVPAPAIAAMAAAAGLAGTGGDAVFNMNVTFSAFRSSNNGLAGGGIVTAREFTLPVQLCDGCTRTCISTLDDAGVELCTAERCAGREVASGGACGNAQGAPAQPPCCSGDSSLFCG